MQPLEERMQRITRLACLDVELGMRYVPLAWPADKLASRIIPPLSASSSSSSSSSYSASIRNYASLPLPLPLPGALCDGCTRSFRTVNVEEEEEEEEEENVPQRSRQLAVASSSSSSSNRSTNSFAASKKNRNKDHLASSSSSSSSSLRSSTRAQQQRPSAARESRSKRRTQEEEEEEEEEAKRKLERERKQRRVNLMRMEAEERQKERDRMRRELMIELGMMADPQTQPDDALSSSIPHQRLHAPIEQSPSSSPLLPLSSHRESNDRAAAAAMQQPFSSSSSSSSAPQSHFNGRRSSSHSDQHQHDLRTRPQWHPMTVAELDEEKRQDVDRFKLEKRLYELDEPPLAVQSKPKASAAKSMNLAARLKLAHKLREQQLKSQARRPRSPVKSKVVTRRPVHAKATAPQSRLLPHSHPSTHVVEPHDHAVAQLEPSGADSEIHARPMPVQGPLLATHLQESVSESESKQPQSRSMLETAQEHERLANQVLQQLLEQEMSLVSDVLVRSRVHDAKSQDIARVEYELQALEQEEQLIAEKWSQAELMSDTRKSDSIKAVPAAMPEMPKVRHHSTLDYERLAESIMHQLINECVNEMSEIFIEETQQLSQHLCDQFTSSLFMHSDHVADARSA